MNSEKINIFIIVLIIPRHCITGTHSSSSARPNIHLPLPSVAGNVAVFLNSNERLKAGESTATYLQWWGMRMETCLKTTT